MGKFKAGLFFGGLLGAGLVWLNATKKGRETRDQILDHAAKVYTEIKNKAQATQQYKHLTKNEYVLMVKDYVDKYAVQNGLAENVKKMINKILENQWKNIVGN